MFNATQKAKMTYKNFSLLVDFGGVAKYFEISAVSIQAAIADLECSLTDGWKLIQWKAC